MSFSSRLFRVTPENRRNLPSTRRGRACCCVRQQIWAADSHLWQPPIQFWLPGTFPVIGIRFSVQRQQSGGSVLPIHLKATCTSVWNGTGSTLTTFTTSRSFSFCLSPRKRFYLQVCVIVQVHFNVPLLCSAAGMLQTLEGDCQCHLSPHIQSPSPDCQKENAPDINPQPFPCLHPWILV